MTVFFKLIFLLTVSFIVAHPVQVDDRIHFRDENHIDDYDNFSEELSETQQQNVDLTFEEGQHYQGDIILLPDQREAILSNSTDEDFITRTGLLFEYQRWPKTRTGLVMVPYMYPSMSEYCELNYGVFVDLKLFCLQRESTKS